MSSLITADDLAYYIEGFSSGYPFVDYLTGIPDVFFPKGLVTEVMGLKSTSKTTLVAEAIACEHKKDSPQKTLYNDYEKSVKKQALYWQTLGVDISNKNLFDYRQPESFQEGATYVLNLLQGKIKGEKQQDYAFIIFDTVAAMRPSQELENGFDKTKQQGLRGKLMSEFLRNLTADLAPDGPAIIFINQLYEQVNINKGPAAAFLPPTFDSSASNALKYYASFRVSLTLKGKLKGKTVNPFTFEEDEVFIGNVVEATAEKSKIGVPFRKTRYFVRYGLGIDPITTLITAGINKPMPKDEEVIKVEGRNAFFSYKLEDGSYSKRFKGMVEFQNFLLHDKDAALTIANQISQSWINCIENFNKTPMEEVQDVEAEMSDEEDSADNSL